MNKYCHKCNIQFCSECEEKAIHSNHYVITLTKKFKSEKIKEVKEIIEVYKNDFKTYIRTFMQKYFNNFPKNKHIYITNDLLKNYIQDMKNFFHFCSIESRPALRINRVEFEGLAVGIGKSVPLPGIVR